MSNEVGKIDNFRALASIWRLFKLVIYLLYTTALCTYSIYLPTSDWLSFVISYTEKQ